MLDSLQRDVQKLYKAVQSASLDSEGIKERIKQQESSMQLLLTEDENMRKTLTNGLRKLSEQRCDAKNLASLFDEIHSIPASLTGQLSLIKTDLLTCIHNELQDFVHSRIEDWTLTDAMPYTAVNFAKAVFHESNLPCGQRALPSVATVGRTRQSRKLATSVKQPCKARILQSSPKLTPIGQGSSQTVNLRKSRSSTVGRMKHVNQQNSKRGAARQAKKMSNVFVAVDNTPDIRSTRKGGRNQTIVSNPKGCLAPKQKNGTAPSKATKSNVCVAIDNPPSDIPSTGKGGSNQTVVNKSKGWLAPKTIHRTAPLCKSLIVTPATAESNFLDDITFEMEDDGDSCFFPGNTISKTVNISKALDDIPMEDEAKAIRKKILQARRKRQRSSCFSCD